MNSIFNHKNIFVVIAVVSALFFCNNLYSQNMEEFKKQREAMLKEFQSAKQKNRETFENFRAKINKEYAEFLNKEWTPAKVEKKVEPELKPEPKPVYVPVPDVTSISLPFVLSERVPKIAPQIRPYEPIVANTVEPEAVLPDIDKVNVKIPSPEVVLITSKMPEIPKRPYNPEVNDYVSFSYYGNTCNVRLPKEKEISVPSTDNSYISKAWEVLSGEVYNDMLVDMLCIRESLSLSDWAFFQLSEHLTEAYFGDRNSKEAAVMQAYIMAQLGFKVRLAKQGAYIFPIIAFNEKVYDAPSLQLDGAKYYIFSPNVSEEKLYLCDFKYPGEKACSVVLKEILQTPKTETPNRKIVSKKYPALSVEVQPNKNLGKFLDDYINCSLEYKCMASLSEDMKEQIYPTLKKAIKGMSQEEAANALINFVQTGFEYKTDEEQFGYEKSFFADEMFIYPYSDCEDRSILFSILVKDLLGLEVVLLDYPSHIATAVHFTTPVEGDFFDLDGKKFIVCDPTYIGATIGVTMPKMKSQECSVIEL